MCIRDSIIDYAAKSAPMRALLKKNATFLWDDACQQAFELLKSDMVSDCCLRYPDLQRTFIFTTDWSKVALGAVLRQQQPVDYNDPDSEEREFVIAYASRGLTPCRESLCTH